MSRIIREEAVFIVLTVLGILVIAGMPIVLLYTSDVVGNWPVMSAATFFISLFLLIGFVRSRPRPSFALKMLPGFLFSLVLIFLIEQAYQLGWLLDIPTFIFTLFFASFYAIPGMMACILLALHLYKGKPFFGRKPK